VTGPAVDDVVEFAIVLTVYGRKVVLLRLLAVVVIVTRGIEVP